ncbi:MAG: DUF1476 domain-containing protein [Alphaproteobacteria bacterium]|nr:DUF1476 domain-containing protein [Alphaproteobacteria bacterium]
MASFNDREKGFENKFKHDEQLRFKVGARRNKLLGIWAAGLMGITGAAAEAYAMEVVHSDFEAPGEDDVLKKVLGDLKAKKVDATEHSVRRRMDELLVEAKAQLMQED